MAGIKVIQTAYKGYNFRSRLEARWAVFFDALGLKWEYEPEGFDLPFVGMYLPDFRVISPQGYTEWYEVKPSQVKEDTKLRAFQRLLRADDKQSAGLLSGDPCDWILPAQLNPFCGICICPRCGALGKQDVWDADDEVGLACWVCDMDTPDGGGHPVEDGVFAPCRPHKGWVMVKSQHWYQLLNKVVVAAGKARSARFEHGQCGATL